MEDKSRVALDLLFGDDAVEMPLAQGGRLCPALADRAIRQFSFLDFVAGASLPLLEKFADARQVDYGELQEAFARVAPARAKTGVMAWLLERFGLDPPPDRSPARSKAPMTARRPSTGSFAASASSGRWKTVEPPAWRPCCGIIVRSAPGGFCPGRRARHS